ncbi:sporulation peptidase YabG [Alkalihalobacillus trypoxylicola]|uniref:Sporulation peptidase YabG n=1 Tax=Alkalihalobacillus trypoxylicola TaxID=519424 RepID=A0A162EMY5_9BACI|nr:sporulation peptidase YabG [Alkalihalobacillus trypoxylicola]KYG33290.1 sporulation peptidase YabG [Alkalihalobacillus trypoxylicola]GAF66527.1 sporulation peptidase YabG [Bacillus sp. TS-2]
MKIQVGDIVARHSYQCDMFFRVMKLQDTIAELAGEDMRLLADAPLKDLKLVTEQERTRKREQIKEVEDKSYRLFRQDAKLMKQRNEYEGSDSYSSEPAYFEMRGRVLHLDGDSFYLRKCTDLYQKLGIPVYGVHLQEKEMPEQLESLLEMVQPDILVVTGHDAYVKSKGDEEEVRAYRHTKYFAECVRIARKYCPHRDQLVIFAGACQSHFETLIKAGANFASSPERINIHALDPVYIVAKVSMTSFMERVSLWDVIRNTITGDKGLGGIETCGAMRIGLPYIDRRKSK